MTADREVSRPRSVGGRALRAAVASTPPTSHRASNWFHGAQLVAVVPARGLWVDANFKENQLRQMSAGQEAEIKLDSHPDHIYRGHVDSIQAGSGARFSLWARARMDFIFIRMI